MTEQKMEGGKMFDNDLMKLMEKALKEKWSIEKLDTELNKLFYEYNIAGEKSSYIQEVLHKMLTDFHSMSLNIISENDINRMINQYSWQLHTQIDKLNTKLKQIFNEHIQDLNYEELKNKIKSTIKTSKNYVDTIVNTTLAGIDQAYNIAKGVEIAQKQGREPRFKYVGPSAERPFCQQHLNNIYTLSEIQSMDNGQGLSVLMNGGGYNCRHQWVRVE